MSSSPSAPHPYAVLFSENKYVINFLFWSLKDWYVSLVRSQCCIKSDSALLEGAELVNRIPQPDLSSFMTSKVTSLSEEKDVISSSVPIGSINRLRSEVFTFLNVNTSNLYNTVTDNVFW